MAVIGQIQVRSMKRWHALRPSCIIAEKWYEYEMGTLVGSSRCGYHCCVAGIPIARYRQRIGRCSDRVYILVVGFVISFHTSGGLVDRNPACGFVHPWEESPA